MITVTHHADWILWTLKYANKYIFIISISIIMMRTLQY